MAIYRACLPVDDWSQTYGVQPYLMEKVESYNLDKSCWFQLYMLQDIELFVKIPGLHRLPISDSLSPQDRQTVLKIFSKFLLRLSHNLDNLIVLRDSRNAPLLCLAPLSFPADVVQLTPRQFCVLLEEHRFRLVKETSGFSQRCPILFDEELECFKKYNQQSPLVLWSACNCYGIYCHC